MFTLKSLSKGTTTGQFKTVKDATEAAQFANETKADGTDDWIPEEKGSSYVPPASPEDHALLKKAINSIKQALQPLMDCAIAVYDLSEKYPGIRSLATDANKLYSNAESIRRHINSIHMT
jgi:hypothetical protein